MSRIPSYRRHKASGQAVVVLRGHTHYLGVYGSEASKERYRALIAEHLRPGAPPVSTPAGQATVADVLAAFLGWAEQRHGVSQLDRIRRSLSVVRDLYGSAPAAEFRGRALRAVRERMIGAGWNRRVVNQRTQIVKQCWRHAVAEELVPGDAAQSVFAVPGLRRGESAAPEPGEVPPVALDVVQSTLTQLRPMHARLVLVQLHAGCRPGEAVRLAWPQIDRTRPDLWVYRPARHKTASRGHRRQIFLGPRAIEALGPPGDGWCFPGESVDRDGSSGHYTVSSYYHAIQRACDRAGVPRWHPHQLRHTAATQAVALAGWDAARIYLGHRTLDATRIYAEDDLRRVEELVRRVG